MIEIKLTQEQREDLKGLGKCMLGFIAIFWGMVLIGFLTFVPFWFLLNAFPKPGSDPEQEVVREPVIAEQWSENLEDLRRDRP